MCCYDSAMNALECERRKQRILEQMPQVQLIAYRLKEKFPEGILLDDLISTGMLGLIAAIDNFDENAGVQLGTYAEYRIRGAILDGLRDLNRWPRKARDWAKRIE